MSDYIYRADGKLHTRYSELFRCTEGQIERVVAEHFGQRDRYESEDMKWGTDRHEMWSQESHETGLTPACFNEVLPEPLQVEKIEEEGVVELYPTVVIHFRPDSVAVAKETVVDYKTARLRPGEELTIEARQRIRAKYQQSRQLKFYGYLLGVCGIRIRRGVYLIEIWNHEHTEILGYEIVTCEYKLSDYAELLPWTRNRLGLILAAVEEWEQAHGTPIN